MLQLQFLDALQEKVDPDWRWLCLGMATDCTASEALGMGSVVLFYTTAFVATFLHYIIVIGNRRNSSSSSSSGSSSSYDYNYNYNYNYDNNDNRYRRHIGAATATATATATTTTGTTGTAHEAVPIMSSAPSSTKVSPTRHTKRRSSDGNNGNAPDDELLALCGLMVYFFVFAAGCLLWALKGAPMVHPLHNCALQLVGSAVLVLCSCCYAMVHSDLGNNWSPFPERLENHHLVTTGLFSWARHPLYAVILWATLGTLLATLNWLVTWVVAGFCGMVLRRIQREEAILLDLFGDDYREYQNNVPALGWPWS